MTEVVKRENGALMQQPEAPAELSMMAVIAAAARDPQVDPAKMEALLALKERIEAREAERAYNAAFAQMQLRLPRVSKNGEIRLKEATKPLRFGRWEDIDTVIRPILSAHGFTLSFSSEPQASGVLMIATLAHEQGHSRQSKMQLPPDAGPGRNALQAIGSSHSYGKRYLTADMLNLVFDGQDDDGNGAGYIDDKQLDTIMDLVTQCGMDKDEKSKQNFLKYMGADAFRNIYKSDYRKAITALEAKHRKVSGQ